MGKSIRKGVLIRVAAAIIAVLLNGQKAMWVEPQGCIA